MISYEQSILPDSLVLWDQMESIIADPTDENIEYAISDIFPNLDSSCQKSVYLLILEKGIYPGYKFVQYEKFWRKLPKLNQYFFDIPDKFSRISKKCSKESFKTDLYYYFYSIGLINENHHSPIQNSYPYIFPKKTIGRYIETDDLDSVIEYSVTKDISSIKIEFWEQTNISLISLSAFLSSIKTFKYIYLNTTEFPKDLAQWAVSGGNSEIIEMLSSNRKINLKDQIQFAIKFHRNEIANWIQQNFNVKIPIIQKFDFNTLYMVYRMDVLHENKIFYPFLQKSFLFDNFPLFYYIRKKLGIDQKKSEIDDKLDYFSFFLTNCYEFCEYFLDVLKQENIKKCAVLTIKSNNFSLLKLLKKYGFNYQVKLDDGLYVYHYCIKKRKIDFVKIFIEEDKCDIQLVDDNFNNGLHYACLSNDIEMVKYLISKGVDLDESNKNGIKPIHIACQKKNIDIVKYLLSEIEKQFLDDSNQNINLKMCNYINDNQLMSFILNNIEDCCDLIRNFLKIGASPNIPCSLCSKDDKFYLTTPIMAALYHKETYIVYLLYEYSADLLYLDPNQKTPFLWAVESGNLEIVKFLKKHGANLFDEDIHSRNAVALSTINGHLNILEYLYKKGLNLSYKDENGNSLLHIAAEKGFDDILSFLLEKGLYINQVNKKGKTPLMLAVEKSQKTCVYILLSNGADKTGSYRYAKYEMKQILDNSDILKPCRLA